MSYASVIYRFNIDAADHSVSFIALLIYTLPGRPSSTVAQVGWLSTIIAFLCQAPPPHPLFQFRFGSGFPVNSSRRLQSVQGFISEKRYSPAGTDAPWELSATIVLVGQLPGDHKALKIPADRRSLEVNHLPDGGCRWRGKAK